MQKIYLDNASTTPIAEEVIDAMVDVMKLNYGNPSSTHSIGQEAKTLLETERRKIANYLKVSPAEIIFTSCGTESNNMIIKSCVQHLGVERIVTSPLEHKCVSESVLEVEKKNGVEVVNLHTNKKGDIDLDELSEVLKFSEKKTLVSLMHANNEIGNLLDIEKVAKICKEIGALFHSDTVQTIGHLDLDFSKIPIDFASSSAHKFHGPKGVGFAFIRKSSHLKGIISGGAQERGHRAGTENVFGIVGLGKAMEYSIDNLENFKNHIQEIKDYAIEKLKAEIPNIKFNGRSDEKDKSLYTLLSILLPYNDAMIGLKLDMKGIAISQGSACAAGALQASPVMMTILEEDEKEKTTPLRISFSHFTTKDEIDIFVKFLKEIGKNNK